MSSIFYRFFSRLFRICLTVAVIAGITAPPAHAAGGKTRQPVDRYGSIVIDHKSGRILYSVNPDRRSYPASLTKVMTLYLLFDALNQGRVTLQTKFRVSAHATKQAPSKLGLQVGDLISTEDAIMALVIKSANDVAVVVAEGLGGSESAFAGMMTRKARQLGMRNTTYRNASGLPNPGQISTPRDQAILGRALIRAHSGYYNYFSARRFSWNGEEIPTHNRLMLRYEGADGIKTGYINASGFNLLSSAVRDNQRLVGVVFGGNTAAWRDNNMAQILDRGFDVLAQGGATLASAPRVGGADPTPPPKKPVPTKKVTAVAAQVPDKKKPVEASTVVAATPPAFWSIQVGAFPAEASAKKAAAEVSKHLGGSAKQATVKILPTKQGKSTLYRARLSGFKTETLAQNACSSLVKAKRTCLVVQPGS